MLHLSAPARVFATISALPNVRQPVENVGRNGVAIADVYTGLGEPAKALALLEKALHAKHWVMNVRPASSNEAGDVI